jgi:hypothetical protein
MTVSPANTCPSKLIAAVDKNIPIVFFFLRRLPIASKTALRAPHKLHGREQ